MDWRAFMVYLGAHFLTESNIWAVNKLVFEFFHWYHLDDYDDYYGYDDGIDSMWCVLVCGVVSSYVVCCGVVLFFVHWRLLFFINSLVVV